MYTPAEERGFKLGGLYTASIPTLIGYHDDFKPNEVLKFIADDGSDTLEFKSVESGKHAFVNLKRLEPCNKEDENITDLISKLKKECEEKGLTVSITIS